ncbi:MAG: purine-nucleoside phosphorylase [Pirellulaceae bacterium]
MSNVLFSTRDARESTEKLSAALAVVRKFWKGTAEVGLILGTGCGDVADAIDAEAVIPYDRVPQMPRSTALAHKGQFVCGTLQGTSVIAMQGRCHLYEGYGFDDVTLGVRIMHAVGARRLVLSNAAGGMNPAHATGDIVLVTGHVNLMWQTRTGVLRGTPAGPGRSGESVYDPELIDLAASVARRENFTAHRGVYVAVSGPNYETRAEYRFFRRLGDVVGMSTVPEALVAAECGLRVIALSLVTNVARPDAPERVDAEDVVVAARRAEPNLRKIVLSVVSSE